jgi:hypothetical protein
MFHIEELWYVNEWCTNNNVKVPAYSGGVASPLVICVVIAIVVKLHIYSDDG